MFGCKSIKLSVRSRNSLDKHQTKLLKSIFGVFMFNDSSDKPHNILVGRMKIFARKENFDLCNYIFSDIYNVATPDILHLR